MKNIPEEDGWVMCMLDVVAGRFWRLNKRQKAPKSGKRLYLRHSGVCYSKLSWTTCIIPHVSAYSWHMGMFWRIPSVIFNKITREEGGWLRGHLDVVGHVTDCATNSVGHRRDKKPEFWLFVAPMTYSVCSIALGAFLSAYISAKSGHQLHCFA